MLLPKIKIKNKSDVDNITALKSALFQELINKEGKSFAEFRLVEDLINSGAVRHYTKTNIKIR